MKRNPTPTRLIAKIMIKHPLWGARRLQKALAEQGYVISVSAVHRRIRQWGRQRTRRNAIMESKIRARKQKLRKVK